MAWLGKVPEHWNVISLGKLSLSRCDGPFGSGLKSEHYTDSGVRVVRLQNIRFEGFGGDEAFIDADYYSTELGGHDVVADDLLIAGLGDTNNTVGRACVAPAGVEPAMVKADCFRFRLNESLAAPTFVAAALNASAVSDAGILSSGSTRSRIPLSVMASRRLALPPLSEQLVIAAFLDRETAKIDALVAEQRRLIELLKEKRQAVISHAVTKGLNPDVPMKDSGVEWLGQVPAHWEVKRVAAMFNSVAESGSADLPILSVSIHDGVSDKEMSEDEMERKITRSDDRTKYVRVVQGDLVYNMMRAWQGAFGTVAIEGMVSPAYVVARPRTSCPTRFVELVLRTPQAIEQMRRYSKGITDFRMRLYWDEFKNLSLPIPPSVEVEEILRRIGNMDAEFGALEAEVASAVALLQERRAALISAAVTGQIDVRSAIPEMCSAEPA